MKTKKVAAVNEYVGQLLKVKEHGSGALIIEGFANKAVVDRGNDFIDPKAWDLKNFEKNPVILFNHNSDMVIGKAPKMEPTEQGLMIQARISSSKAPDITKIRDLIKEGMLTAFSVGFDPKEEQKDNNGVNQITKAELFEVSVVGVPMNQDSIFEIVSKSLETKSAEEIELIKKEAAVAQGKDDSKMDEDEEDKDDKACDEDHDEEKMDDDEEGPDLGDYVDVGSGKDKSEDSKMDEDDDEEKMDVDDDEDKEGKDDSSDESKNFQECVAGKIPTLIDEGKEQSEAVAIAISMCQSEGKCDIAPNRKDYENYFEIADNYAAEKEAKAAEEKQAQDPEVNPVTTPIQMGGDQPENPYLAIAQQSNVLLGTLISEIQKLSAKMDNISTVVPHDGDGKNSDDELKTSETPADEQGKSKEDLDFEKKYLEDLNQRLKKLGY